MRGGDGRNLLCQFSNVTQGFGKSQVSPVTFPVQFSDF